ncbi:AEC family transporter, partial [Streptomyces flaveolus]|uniref:AEC family transporter n=1 Tax=Streptomyces flaveolus TaxID=67297 RepID=UPI0034499E80
MAHKVAAALLPVFFVLILGYAAGRFKMVDNREVSAINRLVMTFAIPIALFVAITSTTRADLVSHGGYMAVLLIALCAVYAAVLLLEVKVFKHDKGTAGVQALTVAFPNFASIGLPLSAAVIGKQGAIAVAIGLALGAVTVSPVTLALLEDWRLGPDAPGSTLSRFGSALGKSVRRPIFWAPMLAFVLVLADVRVP